MKQEERRRVLQALVSAEKKALRQWVFLNYVARGFSSEYAWRYANSNFNIIMDRDFNEPLT